MVFPCFLKISYTAYTLTKGLHKPHMAHRVLCDKRRPICAAGPQLDPLSRQIKIAGFTDRYATIFCRCSCSTLLSAIKQAVAALGLRDLL